MRVRDAPIGVVSVAEVHHSAGELRAELQHVPRWQADPDSEHEGDPAGLIPRPGEPGTFDLVSGDADAKVLARVRPKPVPATLDIESPSHGQLRVTGLARLFPAHTVHAWHCDVVVDGDNCILESMDHYHVRSVSVSFEPLLEPGSDGHAALLRLLRDPGSRGVSEFQQAMRRLAEHSRQQQDQRGTTAGLPVGPAYLMLASGSKVVKLSDGSDVSVTTHYMVERSELPMCDLLAGDESLVSGFLDAVREPLQGHATHAFLRAALGSAGRAEDMALLDHSSGLHGPDTSVRGLFGMNAVNWASAVMVGTGDRLEPDMRVDRGRAIVGSGLADLGRLRALGAPIPGRHAIPGATRQGMDHLDRNAGFLRPRGFEVNQNISGPGRADL